MKISVFIYTLILLLILTGLLPAANLRLAPGNDIEILYLYKDPVSIDWALIYHLGVEKECLVNMVTLENGPEFRYKVKAAEVYDIRAFQFYITEKQKDNFDSALSCLNNWRRPDIVIFAGNTEDSMTLAFEDYLLNRPFDDSLVFNIRKYFRQDSISRADVFINAKYYFNNYGGEINDLRRFFSTNDEHSKTQEIYSSYKLIHGYIEGASRATILAGIDSNRLNELIKKYAESYLAVSTMQAAADDYLKNIYSQAEPGGTGEIDNLVLALRSLRELSHDYHATTKFDSITVFGQYLSLYILSVSSRILDLAGVDIKAGSIVHETPAGRKLKLNLKIDNNGPLNIQFGQVTANFDSEDRSVELPLSNEMITPYNNFEREFMLDIDLPEFESERYESLSIKGTMKYRGVEIDFVNAIEPMIETPLKVALIPDFALVKPLSDESIDKLVEPIYLKATITKLSEKPIDAKIKIIAPPGTMMGAYKNSVSMAPGAASTEISIPLVATRKLTPGKKPLIINIVDNNNIIAADTAYIGIVRTEFNGQSKIALLPGNDGLLEDILSFTGSNYRTISNRYLETGDIDQFDIIALGTGCFQNSDLPEAAREKLQRFMEYGGTVLVFGQPEDWPADLLPVSIISVEEYLPGDQLSVANASHPLFAKTNATSFMQAVNSRYKSYPAFVSPSESIVYLDKQTSVLAESKFKKGKFIYCGLPLLEMFQNLDIVAITFFASLINYSGK